MCEALDYMENKIAKKHEIKGAIDIMRVLGKDEKEIIDTITSVYDLTKAEAEELVLIPA